MTSINSRLLARRRRLKQGSMFSTVEPLPDGTFRNIITGKISATIDLALTEAAGTRIQDLRQINAQGRVQTGQRSTGLDAIADRVIRLNNYLSDPLNEAALRENNLSRLIGGSVDGTLAIFNTENNKSIVAKLEKTINRDMAGEYTITDEGIQLLSFSRGRDSSNRSMQLTLVEQGRLKALAGIETVSDATVEDFLQNISQIRLGDEDAKRSALDGLGKTMGKLTKRIQTTLAPRNVSLSEEQISKAGVQLINSIDEVEDILKTAGGGYEEIDDLQKLFFRGRLNSAENADSVLVQGPLGVADSLGVLPDLDPQFFRFKKAASAADQMLDTIQRGLQLRDGSGQLILGAEVEANQMKEVLEEAFRRQTEDGRQRKPKINVALYQRNYSRRKIQRPF